MSTETKETPMTPEERDAIYLRIMERLKRIPDDNFSPPAIESLKVSLGELEKPDSPHYSRHLDYWVYVLVAVTSGLAAAFAFRDPTSPGWLLFFSGWALGISFALWLSSAGLGLRSKLRDSRTGRDG